MEIIVSLLVGIILGSVVTYYVLRKSQQREVIKRYEAQIQSLENQRQRDVKNAKDLGKDRSRSTIKGQVAEQFAPLFPDFK